MMSKIVVVKDSSSVITIEKTQITIKNFYEDRIVGVRNIKALYLNQHIAVVPAKLIYLQKFFDIYFIDRYGYILGSIKKENNG